MPVGLQWVYFYPKHDIFEWIKLAGKMLGGTYILNYKRPKIIKINKFKGQASYKVQINFKIFVSWNTYFLFFCYKNI
jgi:hypothetical protein